MKIHKQHSTFLLGLLLLLGSACDIINPAEDIPAYLYVPDIDLVTEPSAEGTDSEKITELWLSVNNDFLGAYSLPALIPILETGPTSIVLQAGIKDNGIVSTPDIYPYYERVERELDLQPNQTDTLRPAIGYSEETQFAFIETFERSGHLFKDVRRGVEDQFQLVTEGAFENGQSARIKLDTANFVFEAATTERFSGLRDKSPFIYLEVNYRSDVPVIFGLVGFDANGLPSSAVAQLNPGFAPRQDWNKIYFNLSEIAAALNKEEYQVVLQAFLPVENGQFTRQSGSVWLDNIKLVHF